MLYTSNIMTLEIASKILPLLKDKLGGFALAGGTALSKYYYKHRESFDLDFFSKQGEFSRKQAEKIIGEIRSQLNVDIKLVNEKDEDGLVKLLMYIVKFDTETEYKIDFVEDYVELQSPLNNFDGISVYSIEDIYLRKIITVTGHVKSEDVVGRDMMLGGRQEAKDFYDLYFLSMKRMQISDFISGFNDRYKEALINWYKTFDRTYMKTGVVDLIANDRVEYPIIYKHFEEQIDIILERQIGDV